MVPVINQSLIEEFKNFSTAAALYFMYKDFIKEKQIGNCHSTFPKDLAQLEEKVPSADSGTAVTILPEPREYQTQ